MHYSLESLTSRFRETIVFKILKIFDAKKISLLTSENTFIVMKITTWHINSLNFVGHVDTISSDYNINGEFTQHTDFEITVVTTPPR